jgi:hypothetical protein
MSIQLMVSTMLPYLFRLTEINSREYLEDFEARLLQQQQQPLQGVGNGSGVVLA